MSIYNEYRPTTFADVVGQETNALILKKQIQEKKAGNAYIFYGHHGCGKTTVARIFAKAVNCEHPIDGNPCGNCPACRSMQGGHPDIIEIDAASNNSVEAVRELISNVQYETLELNHRVYIIDEVHMLSTAAFNALLKTLEEPPKHVIFILCTTEIYKVPKTIQSRCQKFLFSSITGEDIVSRLLFVASDKGVSLSEDAAKLIADASDGAMRDALSILEQCITSGQLDVDSIRTMVGILPETYLFSILAGFSKKDVHSIVTAFNGLTNEQVGNRVIRDELMKAVSDRMAYITGGEQVLSLTESKERIEKIAALNLAYEDCIALMDSLGGSLGDIRCSLLLAVSKAEMLHYAKKYTDEQITKLEKKLSVSNIHYEEPTERVSEEMPEEEEYTAESLDHETNMPEQEDGYISLSEYTPDVPPLDFEEPMDMPSGESPDICPFDDEPEEECEDEASQQTDMFAGFTLPFPM